MKEYYSILRYIPDNEKPQYLTARGTFSDYEVDSFLFTNYGDMWATVNSLVETFRMFLPGYYTFEIRTIKVKEGEEYVCRG